MSKKMCPNRRNFLKITAAGAAGFALTSNVEKIFAATARTAAGIAPLNQWPGRVVINFNKNAPTGNVDPTAAQITIIKGMVDASIQLLTGQTTVGAAWKAVFPASLSLTSLIAIKVPVGINAMRSAPHWSSVQAITEGLQQMDFNGTKFPAGNITIFDATGSNALSATGFTATNFPGITLVKPTTFTAYTDAAEDNTTPTGVKMPYVAPLNAANFLINVFSPRGHSTYVESFTLGFKNHYGTYNAPSLPHANPAASQILRNINCMGAVYTKNVLSVCSGIYGCLEGNGPSHAPDDYSKYSQYMDASSTNTNPTTIIMGTDPVSVEMQAVKMMRIQGLTAGTGGTSGQYTTAAMPNFLKAAGGVVVTGTNWPPDPANPNTMDKIGIIDESQMTIRRIINGVTVSVRENGSLPSRNAGAYVTASQIRGSNSTFIEFALPEGHAGKEANLEIVDLKGKLVTRMTHRVGGIVNHLSWNETDMGGNYVGRGTYIVHLVSGTVNVSSKFSITQ
ncbi:MAG: DUF362 domain-containing protein [Chitinispirillaceae bacterium]|jgi:hypothetical protein